MDGNKPYIVRYFKLGDNQKIITTIQKKIYFSKDQNVMPGYYVGSIIDEHERHGVIDTLPMNELPVNIWLENKVSGIFIRTDKPNSCLNIFLSKAPDNIKGDEEPICIIKLSEEEASKAWGENYRDSVMKSHDGIKTIPVNTYTPEEQLREIKRKKNIT